MKRMITSIVLASTVAAPAVAQQKADDHSAHHPPAAAMAADATEGEIRKIDREARKVTLKHGEIKSLGMPPMTMVFMVKDGVTLDKLKAGDKVRFVVEQATTGFVVTDIRPAQ